VNQLAGKSRDLICCFTFACKRCKKIGFEFDGNGFVDQLAHGASHLFA